jgi:CRISPR-associated protein Cas1
VSDSYFATRVSEAAVNPIAATPNRLTRHLISKTMRYHLDMAGLLSGRLGLVNTQVIHADRHGLLYCEKGQLFVRNGTLVLKTAGWSDVKAGEYEIPYQTVSMIIMGFGCSVTHDVLRILASHSVLLLAVGEGGTKLYSAPPWGRHKSDTARRHAALWSDKHTRMEIAMNMFALRFGEKPPPGTPSALRGIEGVRMRAAYATMAKTHGIQWRRRHYDRANPEEADLANQAINHAATFVTGAAEIAVAATGAIPPLGFIHEDSEIAFALDIADIYRITVTTALAFNAVKLHIDSHSTNLEREVRMMAVKHFKRENLIDNMIDNIQSLLGER